MSAIASKYVDFHLHTNHSDGSDAPRRVVERAAAAGFAALAITDHDTLSGIPEALEASRELDIDLLPGVEISAVFGRMEVHILGLGVSLECGSLNEGLDEQKKSRSERARKIVERLRELGVELDEDSLEAHETGGTVGRMHIAQAIVAAGKAKSVQDAFDKFIKAGRPAYVPKPMLTCDRAIELIHDAGGLAFIAHPGIASRYRKTLPKLLQLPFDGIEAYHSKHTPGQLTEFLTLAEENRLLVTGGSDCHGTIKGQQPEMGKVRVPYRVYERMRERLGV